MATLKENRAKVSYYNLQAYLEGSNEYGYFEDI